MKNELEPMKDDSIGRQLQRIAIALEAVAVGFDSTRPEARFVNEMTRVVARDLVPRIRHEMQYNKGFTVVHSDRFNIEGVDFEARIEVRVN